MPTIRARDLLCAGLLLLLSLATASGQRSSNKTSSAKIPTNILQQIIRAEDERRWDDRLKTLLAHKDAQVRKRASLAAGRIGDERAVPVLADLLMTDRDVEVRQMAAFALGEIESPGGAYALLEALKGRAGDLADSTVRARAVEALGKITAAMENASATTGQGSAPKTEDDRLDIFKAAILDTLRFEDNRRPQFNRLTILLGLTAVLRTRPEGVTAPALVKRFLGYDDPRIVADALNTLARLRWKQGNDEARKLLVQHRDSIVRANAARVLGATEDKEAVDALLDRALHDSDLRVRVSAIRALGSLKDVRAEQPLLDRGILLLRAAGVDGSSAATAENIGVTECDAFIVKYNACVSSKVPETARAQYKSTIDQWRTAWKKLADNPKTRGALADACRQAASQQEAALKQYGCTAEPNEHLEIATSLGRLLPNSSNDDSLVFLRRMHTLTKGEAVEVEIAFAQIAPGIFLSAPYRDEVSKPNASWRQVSRRAQALAAIRDVITGAASGSAGDHLLKEAKNELASMLRNSNTPTLAIPDVLQAYNNYKALDSEQFAQKYLQSGDAIVRGTAAETIGSLPSNELNTRALIDALPRALRDKDLNDAALAILDALGKQKTEEANDAIKTALDSSDHLIRRKAVALLKANGVGDFSNRIGTVQTRNTAADYRRAIARIGKRVTATVVTGKGSFTIEFLPQDAPLTVDNFIQLARKGFFNGQTIPRVVPNFVVQAGDPRGDQNGGPGYQIRCEINEVPYERAAVGMALSGKDTGGSQWFVTHSPQPHLDGGYTVFGRVVSGMDIVDRIARGDRILRVIVNER
jgi:cyclophilin family peptidyl-prolyl cis-trans isomerase/HEAT repeat protein